MPKNTKSKPPLKRFFRVVPTVIGLCIIGLFLYQKPDHARRMYQNLVSRFRSTTTQSLTIPTDQTVRDAVSQKRAGLPLLIPDETLTKLAGFISVDIAASPDGKPTLDLEKTASAMGVSYSQLAYLVIVQSPSSIKNFDELLSDPQNDEVLLGKAYTSIGSHSLKTPSPNESIITVITLSAGPKPTTQKRSSNSSFYTGVQLWDEIQAYRKSKGVPEFRQDNTLCTLTSIRVNQLINLGGLDDHKGFDPLVDQYRAEGKITFGNLGENILSGYPTAQAAVAAWDGSLGHKALMSDGSYVWACASANHGYAVLIAAY